MPTSPDLPAPPPSAEAQRLIKAHGNAKYSCGAHLACPGGYIAYVPLANAARAADRALSAYVAGLEAEVARLREIADAAEVPRGLYLALADASPGVWHGGHRCDGAIRVGLPGERASIGQDMPAMDARAAAEAVNFARRLDAVQRGRVAEGGGHG